MFYSGQKVVCINDSQAPDHIWERGAAPKRGTCYTVLRALIDVEGDEILLLCEIARSVSARLEWNDPDLGYGAYRFRPLVERKTDISVFEQALNNSPRERVQEAL